MSFLPPFDVRYILVPPTLAIEAASRRDGAS